jgi:hypothetical protein
MRGTIGELTGGKSRKKEEEEEEEEKEEEEENDDGGNSVGVFKVDQSIRAFQKESE